MKGMRLQLGESLNGCKAVDCAASTLSARDDGCSTEQIGLGQVFLRNATPQRLGVLGERMKCLPGSR
jgi:hypothetical protein